MEHRSAGPLGLAAWSFGWALVAASAVSTARAEDGAAGEAKQTQGAPSAALREEAAQRFDRGVTLFQNEAYRAALMEFRRAYDLVPNYRLLYNIGQTHMMLQEYLEATRAFEGYLVEGGDEVPPPRRRQVEEELRKLREFVAFIAVEANVPEAQVFVDDKQVGTTPLKRPVAVNLGRHRITVNSADGRTATQVVDVAAGDVVEVALELEAPERAAGPKRSPKQRAAIGLMSAGGGLIVGAVVVGLMQRSAQRDYVHELERRPGVRADIDDAEGKAKALALTTDLLGGLAIGAAATGVVLLLMGKDKREAGEKGAGRAASFGVRIGGGGATVHSRVRF